MATPYYPPAIPGGMAMEPPNVTSLKSFLSVARIISLVLWILGGIAVLFGIVSLALVFLGFFGFSVVSFVYDILFTVVNFLTWMQLGEIREAVDRQQYAAVRERILLWMVLGWFFLIINGVILLLALMKLDEIIRGAPMAAPAMGYAPFAPPASPAAPGPAAPAPAPVAAPPFGAVGSPPAPAPAVPNCPRCGQPATWIPQYGRFYCYRDAQYL